MELTDAIMTTRAMRRLTDDPPVTDGDIRELLRLAVQAPSGGNVQPWHFVVLSDPEVRAAMAGIYLRCWERYRSALVEAVGEPDESLARQIRLSDHLAHHIGEVKSVLVCIKGYPNTLVDDQGPLDIGTLHASVLPAVQNLLLAARDRGLGTTLTTVWRIELEAVKALLDIPDRVDPVALIPVGRPVGRFGVAPRRPAEEVTTWNRYRS